MALQGKPPRQHTLLRGRDLASPEDIAAFREKVWNHYRQHGRSFPWRQTREAYRILVSEFMLQQTPVERVVRFYEPFLEAFPDFGRLAQAPLPEVLTRWKGLGYNRRALALRECARRVVNVHAGRLPPAREALLALPGIGPATAGALLAFAFDLPVAFIETNIRRVFLHVFFPGQTRVRDAAILALVEQTLDRSSPRQWYYALMDYGAHLKGAPPDPNRRSAHYARQAPFEDSNRQLRGLILQALLDYGPLNLAQIQTRLSGRDPRRVQALLEGLAREGFLRSGPSGIFRLSE